ncbi:MAG: hypothetical protein LBF34_00965 [Puniceicoccales bacterium]|jgi:hypothetical protein|nr:hypothetical protein [Puniceicoccales bacterium]
MDVMKTLTFKSRVGLLPTLAVLFISSGSSASVHELLEREVGELSDDSSAAASEPEKRVTFQLPDNSSASVSGSEPESEDPWTMVGRSRREGMRTLNYSGNPAMLEFQRKVRAMRHLAKGGRLYKEKIKGMRILTPGDPYCFTFTPGLAEAEVSPERIERESIRIWKEHDLDKCIQSLECAEQCFQNIADYSDLDEFTRDYYGALVQVTSYFIDAFDTLQEGSLSAEQIARELEKHFENSPMKNRVRGVFYAVEGRLKSELLCLSMKEPEYRRTKYINFLGILVIGGLGIVLRTFFSR